MNSLFIENGLYNIITASNVGLADLGLNKGWNEISWDEAKEMINKIDKLELSIPKGYKKKIRALRGQIILSFGPEFEEEILK